MSQHIQEKKNRKIMQQICEEWVGGGGVIRIETSDHYIISYHEWRFLSHYHHLNHPTDEQIRNIYS